MLDDLKYIHEKDQDDALGVAADEAERLRAQLNFTGNPHFEGIQNVVQAGMGGSGLPGVLATSWPTLTVPFQVVRDYDIPAYVTHSTLFIADSYSGNTEETISALNQALEAGAQVAVIAKAGKLQEIAQERNLPFIQLPDMVQPRYAALINMKALLMVFVAAGLVSGDDVFPALDSAAQHIEQSVKSWLPTVPVNSNPAKQLAQELIGKSIVVYAGPKMSPAAYKWKISFNENAKQVAWTGQLPEFNHNEFIGWTKQPVEKPYAIIDLRSSFEHPRVQKRFEVSARLLSGMRPQPHIVEAVGDSFVEQLLWTVIFGDFVSIYLGLLNGLNPANIDLVERFKAALDE